MIKKKIVKTIQNPLIFLLLICVFSVLLVVVVLFIKNTQNASVISSASGSLYQFEHNNQAEKVHTGFLRRESPHHLYTMQDEENNASLAFYFSEKNRNINKNRRIKQHDKTSLTLEDIMPDVNLTYHIEPRVNGVKEDIVIKHKRALSNTSEKNPYKIQFQLEASGIKPTYNANGQLLPVFQTPKGKSVYELLPPYMSDAKGIKSEKIQMIIEEIPDNPSSYLITIIPDQAWLNDKERVFPIIIDPTVVKGTTPIASWRLDEGTGSTASDDSGNSNHFTVNGSTWIQTSSEFLTQTSALQFDGTNDSLSRTYDADFDFGTGSFSVSMWFKHTSVVSGTDTLMARYNGAGWKIYMQNTGYICFGIDDDATFNPDDSACSTSQQGSYADSKWHHLEAVKSSTSSITLYIDGKQVAQDSSLAATATLSGTTPVLYAGIDSNGSSNPWTGFLDTLTIYNYARSADQVKTDYMVTSQIQAAFGSYISDMLTDGLDAWWKLDETASPSLNFAGGTNNGVWTNGATSTIGKFNSGISLDGTNDYVSTSTISASQYTIAAWIKPTGTFSKGCNGGDSCMMIYESNASILFALDTNGIPQLYNGAAWQDATSAVNLNEFTHVAVTSNGSLINFYINGRLDKTISATGGTLSSGSTGYIGARSDQINSLYSFKGVIDDFRIFNRSLSERQVGELYQWSASPIAYWNMDENTGNSSVNDISSNANTLTINTPTGSTVTFGAIVTGTATGSPSSVSTGSSVSATSNTLYIAAISTKNDAAVISSVTGLSLSWSLLDYQCGGRTNTGMHVYYAYGSPVSNGTVTANFSTPPLAEAAIAVARYSNADPSDPIGAVTSSNQYGENSTNCDSGNSSADDTDTPFVTLTTQRNNSYVFGAIGHRLRTLDSTANSFTERADFNSPGGGDAAGIAYIDKYISSAQSIGVGGTISSATDWAMVAGEINGYNNGSVDWRQGRYGSSLELANGGYLSKTDDADFDFTASEQFTISMWFKRSTATAKEYLLTKSEEGVNGGYQLYMASDGDIVFEIDDDSAWGPDASVTTTAANYDDGQWHHVSVLKNGTTGIYIYIDGVFVVSNTSISGVGSLVNNDSLYIGVGDDGVSNYFNGSIDDIKIYRYNRSQSQIEADMNGGHPSVSGSSTKSGAILKMPFDEGYGTTTNNNGYGGTNYNGTLGTGSSAPSWTLSAISGKALSFDGTNDYVSINNSITTTGDMTATFWMKTSATGSQVALSFSSSSSDHLFIGTYSSGKILATIDGSAATGKETSAISLGVWNHVAVVKTSSGVQKIYVNGRDMTQSAGNFWSASASSKIIGASTSLSAFFNGQLDEINIYPSVLSYSQILTDYNRSAGTVFGSLTTATDGATHDNSSAREYCVPGDTSTCNAAVGEWKLDENTGTSTAYDTSGNGRNGTLTSILESSWKKGKKGSALELDGASDYVDIGTGPSTVNSISFWAYPETTTEYFVNLTSTTHYIWLSGGTVTATGLTNPIIYVNGIRTSTMAQDQWSFVTVTTSSSVNANNLDIGRTQNTNYLQGKIDEVRLYDFVRTPGQINWEYNRGEPMAWYKMDDCGEVSSTQVGNSAVNGNNTAAGNNGTLTIGATGTNTSPGTCSTSGAWFDGSNGKYNYSIDLDGTDDYISISDTFDLRFDGTQDFTLMAWVKRNATGSTHYVFSKEDADNDGYRLQIDAANTVTCSLNATDLTSTATITDTNWHHVACTISRGGNGQVYVDGFASGTATAINNAAMATTTALRIGSRSYTPTNYFYGLIDDARIYPFALTLNQIRVAMNENAISFR